MYPWPPPSLGNWGSVDQLEPSTQCVPSPKPVQVDVTTSAAAPEASKQVAIAPADIDFLTCDARTHFCFTGYRKIPSSCRTGRDNLPSAGHVWLRAGLSAGGATIWCEDLRERNCHPTIRGKVWQQRSTCRGT